MKSKTDATQGAAAPRGAGKARPTEAERKVALWLADDAGLVSQDREIPDFGRPILTRGGPSVSLTIERDGSCVRQTSVEIGESRTFLQVVPPEDAARTALEIALDADAIRALAANGAAVGVRAADLPELVAARVREIVSQVSEAKSKGRKAAA